ncbi:MAG: hypothetical protein K2X42_10110 [Burkholderiaceae bacterium]|nr:hypothetical protein [Burkholderiaceae bacterium]
MQSSQFASNPFVLMTHPEVVLQAVEKSESLARLQGQIFRPLDKPILGNTPADVAAYDRRIDQSN